MQNDTGLLEMASLRIEKIKFLIWAKRQAVSMPNRATLSIWNDIICYSKETATADLLENLPHVLDKDRKEHWWNFPNHYPFMYGLGKAVKPGSYLEIGTRYGYSMVSIGAGARDSLRSITSIDLQEYEGMSQDYAKDNLLSTGFSGKYEFFAGSSHDAEIKNKVKGKLYDLVFVDGDHSYEGALDDILYYWGNVGPGKFMIIDDVLWQVFSNGKKVLRAVKDALPRLEKMEFYDFIGAGVRTKHKPEYGIKISDFKDVRTSLISFYRGLVLIKKGI